VRAAVSRETTSYKAALVLGAAAVAAAGFGLYLFSRPDAREEAARAAGAAAAAVRRGADETLARLQNDARAAAGIPFLRAAIARRVNEETFADLFETEDWWAAYRAHGCALIAGRAMLAVRGFPVVDLPGHPIVERTQREQDGSAAGFFPAAGSAYAIAASRIEEVGVRPTILVLATPLDGPALREALRRAGAAGLALSDGAAVRTLAKQGGDTAPAIADIGRLGGAEARSPMISEDGSWAAGATELAQGLWLWTVVERDVDWTARREIHVATWAAAAILAFACRRAVLRRRRRILHAETVPSAPTPSFTADVDPAARLEAAPALAGPRASSPAFPSLEGGAGAGRSATATALGADTQAFGRYTLLGRLGEGGMSELYTAELSGAEGFQRVVALKRLKPHLAFERAAVDQFIDEAKLGSRLVHSNIVAILDFGKVGEGYFLAQEHVVGRTLAQLSDRHLDRTGRPLPIDLVAWIAHEALAGLSYAHELTDDDDRPLRIVHRDISPANIMVSASGEVKILDFGIAKSESRLAQTDPGSVKGNAAYMAPEQARGQPLDARADLFALGLVMYDLLTGERFYRGQTTPEVLYQAATGPTVDHMRRISELPEPMADILRPALALDPAARYPDGRAFAARLAPLPPDGKTQLGSLVRSLFGDELRPQTAARRRPA